MNVVSVSGGRFSVHQIQQSIKWTVYGLLLINFGFYIYEDWTRSLFTLTETSTILDWTSAFATSIDESAWFLLLFMFELETYTIEDKDWGGWIGQTIRAVRLICIALIAHTVYAFVVTVVDLKPTVPIENVTQLCEMNGEDVSFVHNLSYTDVNAETCNSLSTANEFYWVATDPVVSDMQGLSLERDLALADLVEAIAWLFVLVAIEIAVRLQGRGITGSSVVSAAKYTKWLLYTLLLGLGVYWAGLSHWVYLWDEILWIGGFAAIDMNISQWRDELIAGQASA